MNDTFGPLLKGLRLRAGFGLRRFAALIDMPAPNLSAIEHGRRNPPSDPAKLKELAVALGLEEGSEDWSRFFDAARQQDSWPADVRHLAGRRVVPALLRTIDNRQLSDEEIAQLTEEIRRRQGG